MKTVKFYLNKNHPDYHIAKHHCEQSRILRNGVNSILRTNSFYKNNASSTDLSIVKDYGVEKDIINNIVKINIFHLEKYRKIVEKHQGISLPQKVSQNIIRSLHGNWKSFFSLKKKGLYAKMPGYSKKYHTAEYNNQAINKTGLKNNRIIPTQWSTGFILPSFVDKVKSAKIVPCGNGFELHVLYFPVKKNINYSPVSGLVAAIDPGLNNLFTISFNDFREGIIIDGRPLKKINSHYNHIISDLTSKLDIERKNLENKVNKGVNKKDKKYTRIYRKNSAKLDKMWVKRNRKIKHYSNTATNATVKLLCEAGVEKVVIGWNKGNKQNINIGRRNNRKFVQIPLKSILDSLADKLIEVGIEPIFTEESYTSKSSFLDNDPLPVYGDDSPRPVFSGKRVFRGLYRSKKGVNINADLNGSYNILRKYDPHFCLEVVDTDDSVNIVGASTVVCSVKRVSFPY